MNHSSLLTQIVKSLVAGDATYLSLNYDNPGLKKIMPSAGTGKSPKRESTTCWESMVVPPCVLL
jgi:hypothetical protein